LYFFRNANRIFHAPSVVLRSSIGGPARLPSLDGLIIDRGSAKAEMRSLDRMVDCPAEASDVAQSPGTRLLSVETPRTCFLAKAVYYSGAAGCCEDIAVGAFWRAALFERHLSGPCPGRGCYTGASRKRSGPDSRDASRFVRPGRGQSSATACCGTFPSFETVIALRTE
jgi:hypothetical protein